MRLVRIMERGGEDLYEYKEALKMMKSSLKKAKENLDIICELSDDMESQYSQRGGESAQRMRRRGYSRMRDEEQEY